MFHKLRVGIICGGRSEEHVVSVRSAMYIDQFIDKDRFETLILWIDKQGAWYLIEKKFSKISTWKKHRYLPILFLENSNQAYFYFNNLLKIDVIFPIIHGNLGEDGSLQGFLRIVNVPYVGSDVLGSAICMNKVITKHLLYSSGLPIIPFKTFSFDERYKINFHNIADVFGLPLFIKPVNQGSSIGVSKVDNLNNFFKALDIAFFYSHSIIIEPCIIGRELECAVLGGSVPKASLCGEIILKNNNFYTYHDKYIQHNSKIVIPAVIDHLNSDKIRHIAIQAFHVLHCFGMARVDVFLTENNEIYINEINTLPGFTNTSMYPKLWEATGLTVTTLLTELIELSLNRHSKIFNL